MTVVNTNVKALFAQNSLQVNNRTLTNAMQQLSTGSRINSAKDDAAGLAISQNMTSQIKGMDMAIRNSNDGIGLAQTAEGAMVEVSDMLQRMRELAIQAASGTLSDSQREYLNTEFVALKDQITNTIANSRWNNMNVLTSGTTGVSFTIQTGAESGQTIVITSSQITVAAAADISRVSSAGTAIGQMDTALGLINTARASLGAVINRLSSAADNLGNISQNLSDSRSRVMDTDYAQATAELARTQIIQQASIAVLAQANQQPQTVLRLLQG